MYTIYIWYDMYICIMYAIVYYIHMIKYVDVMFDNIYIYLYIHIHMWIHSNSSSWPLHFWWDFNFLRNGLGCHLNAVWEIAFLNSIAPRIALDSFGEISYPISSGSSCVSEDMVIFGKVRIFQVLIESLLPWRQFLL